jgi:hypothetical protein
VPAAPPRASPQYQALYRSTVQDAAARGSMLMGKLVAAARSGLQAREAACRDLRERDALAQSAKQLRSWESELCKRYPQALLDAFAKPEGAKKAGTQASADVGFDELELMDEVQVLTSVTLARTQQVAMLVAEASLAELNTLICSTLGLGAVVAERNPLRPQIYINALKAVIEQTQLPLATQLDWLGSMSATLGQELRTLYVQLCATLRGQGVAAARYAVVQTPGSLGVGRGVAQDLMQDQSSAAAPAYSPSYGPGSPVGMTTGTAPAGPSAPVRATDDTLLTLDKLRRLLAGELNVQEPLTPIEQFAQRFAREFEDDEPVSGAPTTDFDATVPAALEALKEMEQVDEVMRRLQQRRVAPASPEAGDTSIEAVRAHLRSRSHGVGQALSLEVVTLMIDNIARDARLLAPVQQLIRRLEPPLLRLALVDPRLFTNKKHPARVLVQEVADHSLAYASPQSPGFSEFVSVVGQAFAPLSHMAIENGEPFEHVLNVLREEWLRVARAGEHSRKDAMQALQNAEQRNLLAEKIAREIAAHPDALPVPAVIIDFLCGPWAQVVAQARLNGAAGSAADKYHALISALLWSTHPDLTRKDSAKLTRLVPLLLGTLREGLDTIHYPTTKTSAFFETLMGLHQRAFRAAQKPLAAAAELQTPVAAAARPNLVDDGNPWVAPEEARASNFIDLPDSPADAQPEALTPEPVSDTGDAAMVTDSAEDATLQTLALGSWVELMVNEQWVRTQLTWASPHGTLFLFTNAAGSTQSMTRRSRDRLVAAGQLRVVSGQPVVDGALNAVAQMAMRNSVNTLV